MSARLLSIVLLLTASMTFAAEKPNVLFIAVDDLNDWISCMGGHPQCKTPNIDRLAARGMLFTNAHCAAPACNPSRASLLTGIRPSTSGVYVNPQPWRKALPNAVTLPQHFTANGYWVGGSGKMFHGAFADPQSWQVYYPSLKKQTPPGFSPKAKPLNGMPNTAHFDWGPIKATDEQMSDAKVAGWVCEQLKQDFDKPFFLACGMFRPHLPWYAPEKYFDQHPLDDIVLPDHLGSDLDDIPPAGKKMAKPDGDHRRVQKAKQWKHAVRGYLASIAFMDAQIGRVLDALDESKHADNTIIVFWTDHGWHLGEKQHWRKFALWEEATRTPLMFVVPKNLATKLPTGVQRASRCSQPVGLIDIYPTLIDLCGLSQNERLEGESLLSQLQDPTAKRDRPALTTHGRNNHALRTERFRYIRYENGDEELYDHQADPMEYTNLAADLQYAKVKNDLAKWFPTTNVEPSPRAKPKKKRNKKKAK